MVLLQRVEHSGFHRSEMIQCDGVEKIGSNDEIAEYCVNRRRVNSESEGQFGDSVQDELDVVSGKRRRKDRGELDESFFVHEFGDGGMELFDAIVSDPNGIEFDERMRVSLFLEVQSRRIDLICELNHSKKLDFDAVAALLCIDSLEESLTTRLSILSLAFRLSNLLAFEFLRDKRARFNASTHFSAL